MSWKFWQKSKSPTLASAARLIDWDTDAYGSVKFLFGMYVKNTPPFSEWRDRDVALLPELEEVASTNVKAQQLQLWFALYRRRRGGIESNMLRDAFFHLFDMTADPGEGIGKQVRWLLDFQDQAIEHASAMPGEKHAAVTAAVGTEMPPEYYIAMYQLLGFPDSPYRLGEKELPEMQQRALCVCLLTGKKNAHDFFIPMIEAIQKFDASQIPSWHWLKKLGAHERHLQRRHNNPLFEPPRRIVTAKDVYEARMRDAREHDDAFTELEAVRQELKNTELPYTWFVYLNEKRIQIEQIHDRIAAMDRCGDELKLLVNRLRQFVVGTMRDTLASKGTAEVTAIDEAEAMYAHRQSYLGFDWVRQIMRPDHLIPPSEVTASLLSEDLDALTSIIKSMEQELDLRGALANARTGSLDLVRRARAAGYEIPEIESKLSVLGVAL